MCCSPASPHLRISRALRRPRRLTKSPTASRHLLAPCPTAYSFLVVAVALIQGPRAPAGCIGVHLSSARARVREPSPRPSPAL
eukprot:8848267-Pyramimonas_sp.AAC.1